MQMEAPITEPRISQTDLFALNLQNGRWQIVKYVKA